MSPDRSLPAPLTDFRYELLGQKGKLRRGRYHTPHGTFETPCFAPVGTYATLRGLTVEQVKETGSELILANSYHLHVRPGAERIEQLGGLHKFMNWDGPILTDSGGFQVMSLSGLRKITENGVNFKSHIDGSKHFLSPERSIEIQKLLDSDIVMSFDECTPFPETKSRSETSMRMSMRWAKRSVEAFGDRPGYALFGIQQGSIFKDLREESAKKLNELSFDGYAIGGLAVGEGQDQMFRVLDYAPSQLPEEKPRYLMGVGKPDDIVGAVERGVDMFDCVLPSRSGRTGQGITRYGAVNLRNARHKNDPRPLDSECQCPACRNYSRAYLHHVIKTGEIIGSMLLTWHNLHYYQTLMNDLRQTISNQNLSKFVKDFREMQSSGDIEQI